LLEIAKFGDEKFGAIQSDNYQEKLDTHFNLICEMPEAFQKVDEIRIGYRRAVCGSHSIYYRIANGRVEIMRVLGGQEF
jgi:toxin ParE1/3/4